jgi:hypothetical protein
MDWEPTPKSHRLDGGLSRRRLPGWTEDNDADGTDELNNGKSDWNSFGSGKQRMFASASGDETGLESLVAEWGLGGVSQSMTDIPNGHAIPSAGAPRGVVLDRRLLRSMRFGLCIFRLLGCLASRAPSLTSRFSPVVEALQQPLLALEIAAGCLSIFVELSTLGHGLHGLWRPGLIGMVNLAQLVEIVNVGYLKSVLPGTVSHIPRVDWAVLGILDAVICLV